MINGEVVTDYSRKLYIENEFGGGKRADIIIEGNANNANAFIGVEFRD